MSSNNSKRLLEAKIEYKKGLLEAEKNITAENIKPVENEAVTPKKASLIREMFSKDVSMIKYEMETDYAHQFTEKKAISSFMKINTRDQKSVENTL